MRANVKNKYLSSELKAANFVAFSPVFKSKSLYLNYCLAMCRPRCATLYPLLHVLEQKGYLRSSKVRDGKSLRKVYRATAQGRQALRAAKSKVRELFAELIEGK